MKRRQFFSRLSVAVAAAVATAVAGKANAQGSYYSQQNQQNRDYKRMEQSTQRAYGTNRR
jgi:hypothetical protein